MRCTLFVLITVLVLIPAPELSADTTQSAHEYARLLERTGATLDRAAKAEQKKPGSGLPLLEKLSKGLPSSVPVDSSGHTVRADLARIKRDLEQIRTLAPSKRGGAVADLRAHVDVLANLVSEQPSTNPEGTLKAARSTLSEILSRREYRQTAQERLWERIQRRIWEFLAELLSNIPERTFKFVSWALAIAAGIVLFAALFLVGRYFYKQMSERAQRTPSQRRRSPRHVRSSPEQLLQTAEAQASAGRYKEALRSIYTAALLLLDRARLLVYAESGTNWEYLKTLSELPSPGPADIMQPMTLLFDQKVYGCRDVSAQDYAFGREQYQRLEGVI